MDITERIPARSFGLKLLLVCGLAVLMGLPILLLYALTADRANRSQTVFAEVGQTLGGSQSALGPVLLIPWERVIVEDGKATRQTGESVIFARTGTINGTVTAEPKKRGLFSVPTYVSDVTFNATFDPVKAAQKLDPAVTHNWSRARLIVSLSGARGIIENIAVTSGPAQGRAFDPASDLAFTPDAKATLRPGLYPEQGGSGGSTFATPVGDLVGPQTASFDVALRMKFTGAEAISLVAFAQDTKAAINSNWPDPSFQGAFLPVPGGREVTETGFKAQWSAPYQARGVSDVASNTGVLGQVVNTNFAVRFLPASDIYDSIGRALKYALMFVGFVFLTYFLFEVATGQQAHAAQYVLLGLAQAMFYILLLAFAERIGFTPAYIIAAGMTVFLCATYAGAVFKSRKAIFQVGAALAFVYGLLYILMRREDDALLVGALASFAALSVTMWLTRNVQWYGRPQAQVTPTATADA
jgi:inner membrane protein